MKKILLVSLATLFLLTTFAWTPKGYSKNALYIKDSSINTAVVTDELADILKAWINKNEAQYYKDISVAMTPVKVEIKEGKVEETFKVKISEMLKATTPEELPAIRGMERFKDLKNGELSPNSISAVNKEINSWIAELKGYIGKTETLNIDFKVVADLSENGNILPETVNFFADNSMGDFYRIYSLVLTADEMEMKGFKHVEEIANKAKDAAFPQTSQYCYRVDEYRRKDTNYDYPGYPHYYEYAADYADHYALEYNTNQYMTCTNDCANFVSQAMYAGGVPMSTTYDVENWWYDGLPPGYAPWIWTTPVPENGNTGLRNYMYYNGYWEDSDWYWASAGSVIMWKDTSDYPGHVAMVVENDTINRTLSQYNTDRQHHLYSGEGWENSYYNDNDMNFYTVHHYVTYCYASQPGIPK
ncbi:MAG: hypothetical protein COS15_02510 [Caldiserica bacterium CG02_land_8_20_14_3_00_36_38]|nr:hypothetical protein [Caldisericota bacterium]OIP14015.1 MAG: hypothetical protein AUJ99_00305 [Caldisericum sp. CG2_30_36_11]PIP49311.1 MAG: hypothetical protein COX13_04725 [Caldiserica bacterium CG23_combo_of_CG06-09_8_20_14_all_35_60]PIV55971.1 MAG: hypothetical protein COS15_02510 [Caldiserica bacterium CG02_land_8_20_14_3_00_36_38]PIW11078.1 MAG: hypothetical protein COW37_00610 [Caldiserica bacterium CG17_big_fil_post_rev_8_21_14_2_50_35_7]